MFVKKMYFLKIIINLFSCGFLGRFFGQRGAVFIPNLFMVCNKFLSVFFLGIHSRVNIIKSTNKQMWFYPLFVLDLYNNFFSFIGIWPMRQWVSTIIGMIVCYGILFLLINRLRAFFKLKPIPWRYFTWLMIIDFSLNIICGVYYMSYRETVLGQLFVKCPIAISPVFLIIEIICFWIFAFIKKKR